MKMIICLAALIAVAFAAPVDESNAATVLRFDNENNGVEGYNFGFETSDGISRDEKGEFKNVGTEDEAISVRGSYSFILDGTVYTVTYVADENGFVPEGAHIPKA